MTTNERKSSRILEEGSARSAKDAQPVVGLAELRDHRDAIMEIANRRKASNIRVFGSVAAGAAQAASDVDFLVRMAPEATLVDLIGLEQDLENLLDVEVDVVTDGGINPRMREHLRSTAISL